MDTGEPEEEMVMGLPMACLSSSHLHMHSHAHTHPQWSLCELESSSVTVFPSPRALTAVSSLAVSHCGGRISPHV